MGQQRVETLFPPVRSDTYLLNFAAQQATDRLRTIVDICQLPTFLPELPSIATTALKTIFNIDRQLIDRGLPGMLPTAVKRVGCCFSSGNLSYHEIYKTIEEQMKTHTPQQVAEEMEALSETRTSIPQWAYNQYGISPDGVRCVDIPLPLVALDYQHHIDITDLHSIDPSVTELIFNQLRLLAPKNHYLYNLVPLHPNSRTYFVTNHEGGCLGVRTFDVDLVAALLYLGLNIGNQDEISKLLDAYADYESLLPASPASASSTSA